MASPANPAARPVQTPAPSATRSRTTLWIAVAGIVGLLIGYLLQSPALKSARRDLVQTSQALHAARLEATLSAAVIEAHGGRFESARQHSSDFYTGLQGQLLPVIPEAQQADARALLSERDSAITSLARSDPASAVFLATALEKFRATVRLAKLDTLPVAKLP